MCACKLCAVWCACCAVCVCESVRMRAVYCAARSLFCGQCCMVSVYLSVCASVSSENCLRHPVIAYTILLLPSHHPCHCLHCPATAYAPSLLLSTPSCYCLRTIFAPVYTILQQPYTILAAICAILLLSTHHCPAWCVHHHVMGAVVVVAGARRENDVRLLGDVAIATKVGLIA